MSPHGGARIGIVHFQTWPDIRVAKFAETLAGAGHEVIVLAREAVDGTDSRAKHPYAADLRVAAGVEVRGLVPADAGPLRRASTLPYPLNPVWLRAIDRLLDDGCRLLIVRDFHLVVAAARLAHRRGVPVLFDMAENYPALLAAWRTQDPPLRAAANGVLRNVRLARRLERAAVRAADRVLVVVPEHVERVLGLGARPPVTVVDNTPVVDRLVAGAGEARPADADPVEVVYTGEIHSCRGLDTVIDAARELATDSGRPRIRITCVGTGTQLEQLRQAGAAAGVADTVRFVGWQPDLRPWLAGADVGLIPPHVTAHWDVTMPNKLYDLMAWGRPVVVSDARPMRRVVESANCGVVFRSGDAAGLAAALRSLRDPQTRRTLGESGRAAVAETYTWQRDGAVLLRVAAELLAGGAGSPASQRTRRIGVES
jgi:glycosyltransferase involved in cell wall biosynthesis